MGIFGNCQLVVKWDGIFWGTHGKNSHGASIRLRVTEMNFTPDLKRDAPSRRMLPPMKVVEKEEEPEEELVLSYSDDEEELIILDIDDN